MIIVLADDFSGAAEMAGCAHRLGLKAEVHTKLKSSSKAEIIALDTNTRGLARVEAQSKLKAILQQIMPLHPTWVYKKIDSVLRGHVLPELETIMDETEIPLSVMIPANPSKDRVIRKGQYWIGHQLLHETVFANDPRFPAHTSDVLKRLGQSNHHPLHSVTKPPSTSQEGIFIPDISNADDVNTWAEWLPKRALAVGGLDFFSALLKAREGVRPHHTLPPPDTVKRRLILCGSLAAYESGRCKECQDHGIPILELPASWMTDDQHPLPKAFKNQIRTALQSKGSCLLTIGRCSPPPGMNPSTPAKKLIEAASEWCDMKWVDQVLVEGGETAYLMMESMQWNHLKVEHSTAEGIPELKPIDREGPGIVPKPGSYPWPHEFLDGHKG